MKLSIFKITFVAVCVAAILMTAGSAKANTTINNSEAFGVVIPGNPTSGTTDTAELNDVLATYYTQGTGSYTTPNNPTYNSVQWGNGTYTININGAVAVQGAANGPLPAIDQTQTGTTSFSIVLGAHTYDYLMVKWDNQDVFYDISGITGTLDVVNNTVFNKQGVAQNVSGYKMWNDSPLVPDGGSTIALLGFAMVGLGTLGRKLRRS